MSEEYEDYGDHTFQPNTKDELTAIKHTLKRMEKDKEIFGIF